MDIELRKFYRRLKVDFSIEMCRRYMQLLLQRNDLESIWNWIPEMVPSATLKLLPGLLIRVSDSGRSDYPKDFVSNFLYLSPELKLHSIQPLPDSRTSLYDVPRHVNPLNFEHVITHVINENNPLQSYQNNAYGEDEAVSRVLNTLNINNIGPELMNMNLTQVSPRAFLSEHFTKNFYLKDLAEAGLNLLSDKEIAENSEKYLFHFQQPLTYHLFLPALLEDSLISLEKLCETISNNNQETTVGHPDDRRKILRNKEYVEPDQYFSPISVLAAKGKIQVENHYQHIIEGPIGLFLERKIAYDYLRVTKNTLNLPWSVRIPIAGHRIPPNRFWLSGDGPGTWPLSWPINNAMRELTTFVGLQDAPDEIEEYEIREELLRKVNTVLPAIAARYLQQSDEHPPVFYRRPITEVMLKRITKNVLLLNTLLSMPETLEDCTWN